MMPFLKAATSSVGKKFFMALTGLFWIMFLFIHLLGNLSLYSGHKDSFNAYSDFLTHGTHGVVYVLEFIMVAGLLIHVISAVAVFISAQKARPIQYAMSKNLGGPSRKTISASTMIYTGSLMFIFIIVHLIHFKFGDYYSTVLDGRVIRDMYATVLIGFQSPFYTWFYVIIMALIGFHLRHGFWSAFQSLGLNHPRYNGLIAFVGVLIAITLSLGFLMLPLVLHLTGGPA
jgi:succinate dehydrogenase / fumarate reductase, cytochrome b subunit